MHRARDTAVRLTERDDRIRDIEGAGGESLGLVTLEATGGAASEQQLHDARGDRRIARVDDVDAASLETADDRRGTSLVIVRA